MPDSNIALASRAASDRPSHFADLGPVLHLVVPFCELDTLHTLLQTCTFLRREAMRSILGSAGGVLSIQGAPDGPRVKAWTCTLPWLHPDSPMEPKLATIGSCQLLSVDFKTIPAVQNLLQHLPQTCTLQVFDFPVAFFGEGAPHFPDRIVFPPVCRLRLYLSIPAEQRQKLRPELFPMEHSAKCVELELNLENIELEDWLALPAFAAPSTECLHVVCSGDAWLDIPEDLINFSSLSECLNIYTLFTSQGHGFGSPTVRTRKQVVEALQTVFRTSTKVHNAGADGATSGRLCSIPNSTENR